MLSKDFFIVDADAHWTEPADFFTSRAPAKYRDRMPKVVDTMSPNYVTGVPEPRKCWMFDGINIGPYGTAGVIDRQGNKAKNANEALFVWPFEMVHEGASNPVARLKVLDECGIDAQVIYPSTVGLGGQNLTAVIDKDLSLMAVQIYNDGQAEIQAQSNNRLLPMPLMPAWDIGLCVAEAKRVGKLGMRGINMTSWPPDVGSPDLASREWDPFWEACVDNQLPIHFHIGASVTGHTFYGGYTWKSHTFDTKLALGGASLFIANAMVVMNIVVSGIFDRHPDLKVVSVESGVGWIPFVLEAIDYEMRENAMGDLKRLKKSPHQAFRENMYGTFWFEANQNKLDQLIELVGEDNVMFETDFPHPTCLYPDPLGTVAEKIGGLSTSVQAKILGENARKLYRL